MLPAVAAAVEGRPDTGEPVGDRRSYTAVVQSCATCSAAGWPAALVVQLRETLLETRQQIRRQRHWRRQALVHSNRPGSLVSLRDVRVD